jgi:hypothetical protein
LALPVAAVHQTFPGWYMWQISGKSIDLQYEFAIKNSNKKPPLAKAQRGLFDHEETELLCRES